MATNNPYIYAVSDNSLSRKQKEESNATGVSSLFKVGAFGAGSYAAAKFIANPLLTGINQQSESRMLRWLDASSRTYDGKNYLESVGKANPTFSDISLNTIRAVEEYSPFHIMRTFNLSHYLMPGQSKDAELHISAELVKSQEDYFRSLLGKANGGNKDLDLTTGLKNGFYLKGGSLFEANEVGEMVGDSKVLNYARLSPAFFAIQREGQNIESVSVYKNRVLDKFKDIIGSDVTENESIDTMHKKNIAPNIVVGGKDAASFHMKWARAYGRLTFERGLKVFDKPFEGMLEFFPSLEGKVKLDKFFTLNLGTAGDYSKSVPESLGIMAKNIATGRVAKGLAIAYGANLAVQNIGLDEDNPWSKGLIPGIATAGVKAHLKYAEVVSDNFQEYKEKQEEIAPRSTNFISLLGIPLSAALAGGMLGFGIGVGKAAIKAPEFRDGGNPSKILPFLKAEGGAAKRYAVRGGVLGAALMIPFVPGAFIGKTSEELRDIYSGEQDVAVRANRWWASSGGAWQGDHIKYFDKSWYAKTMADTNVKSLYGDRETQKALSPILHPIDYIRDPYRFEKMHQDDRPYPVWGMDVSFGSFLGKAVEKTIGRVIKPDIINPELENYIVGEGALTNGVSIPAGVNTKKEIELSDSVVPIAMPVSEAEASLIAEGKMTAPQAPVYAPNEEAARWSYAAFKDFIGLKGWTMSNIENGLGFDPEASAPNLARSGEAHTLARKIKDLNYGGLLGAGEGQRRLIPTSAGMIPERINPLYNNMPDWLPGDNSGYWVNFQRGDPYTAIENGNSRLPGKGYESLHTELSGINPEDYPDIYKFKILSDVALGSPEYYQQKNLIDKREKDGILTEYENDMLITIRKQEVARSQKKVFTEKLTEEDLSGMSGSQQFLARYWETLSHNSQQPHEYLSFFRPASNFLHQRTAVEDYERTQIVGSDIALWTKPDDHFLQPAINDTIRKFNKDYIPESVEEKRNVDEFFGKLEYMKYRRLYKQSVAQGDAAAARGYKAKYEKTPLGATTSGLDSEREIIRAYSALPNQEKPYFASFVKADEADREKDNQDAT